MIKIAPPTASLCSYPLFHLCKRSTGVDECQWVPSFPRGGIQFHTFASSALPCQTAPLLQQNAMEYWQGDSISMAAWEVSEGKKFY